MKWRGFIQKDKGYFSNGMEVEEIAFAEIIYPFGSAGTVAKRCNNEIQSEDLQTQRRSLRDYA